MRKSFLVTAAAIMLPMFSLPAIAIRIHRGPTSGKHKKSAHLSHAAAVEHPRAIDDERATEIQTALVKAGYLTSVSGHWDAESRAAMEKLQAENGWQTSLIPDSRALIKLGLGPGAAPQPAVPTASAEATPLTAATGAAATSAVRLQP